MNLKTMGKRIDDSFDAVIFGKRLADIRASKAIPDSIPELLADDDIREMVSEFINENMADVDGLIMIYREKDGTIKARTNLAYVTLFQLMWWAIKSWESNAK